MAATTYKGITIELNGETSKLQEKLEQVRKDSKLTYASLRDVNKALRFDDSSVTALTQKQKYLQDALKANDKYAEAYKAGIEALNKTLAENGKLNEHEQAQYDQLQRSLEGCARQAESYRKQIEQINASMVSMSSQSSGLGRFAAGAQEIGGSLQAIGSKASELGSTLTDKVTKPLVMTGTVGAVAMIKAATDLDSAYHDLTKTVDGTEEELERFRKGAIETSKTQPVSAESVLQVEALGGQLGITNDNLESFAATMNGMDVATDLGAEEAATQLAQFANITGMAQDQFSNCGSAIVALGNNMATTESKTTDMAMRIAAAGKQVGMSEADILGLSAALSSLGLEAEAGGTAVSTIMSQIDKDVATSSDGLATWAAAAGMSAQQFASAWRDSPVAALQAVLSGLDEATKSGGNMAVMLEDLGVSSIRQTDTLKRLAGNSELLTKAVEISNDAWRENTALSDEVASRNESLASKFEVLKNRATAVAAEVGKPLADALLAALDAAQPLITAIEGGARAFAEMDKAQQQSVLTAVALVAALGPALTVVGKVTSGIGSLVSAIGTAAQGVATYREALKAGFNTMEAFDLAAGELGTTLTTGVFGMALAAAGVAIGALVASFIEWQNHVSLVESATAGLEDAVSGAVTAAEGFSDSLGQVARSSQEVREANEATLRSVADFAQGVRAARSELSENAQLADKYADTMKSLSQQGSLTASELEQLKNAVEQYNEITGAAVTITDEQRGTLSLLPDAIDEVTDAYKRQAEQKAYLDAYNDALREQVKVHAELEAAKAELTQAEEEYQSLIQTGAGYGEAMGRVSELKREIEDLTATEQSLGTQTDVLEGSISESAQSFSTLEAALASAGVSASELESLGSDKVEQLRAAFDGSIQSIMALLDRFGVKLKGVSADISGMAKVAGSSVASAAAQVSAGTAQTTKAAAAELKKQNDAAYKEQQRQYDRLYKAQQKAYDQEYKAQQKALEKEYQAASKAYEKQYRAKQKELDKEYQAASKAYDQQYQALSKSLKQQEDALSKSNDRRLKEVQSEQEAEVKAFQKATDEKIAEIDRAYKASLQQMDDEGDGQLKAIYDQIDALDAQTEAERKAIKDRENEERRQELVRKTGQAKTQEEYEQAVKALQDFIASVAQEERETQRAAEKQRLRDTADALKADIQLRRDALKAKRDTTVDSVTEQRAAELEAMRASQAEQLEALRESLAQQLTMTQEAHQAQLATLKEQQQASLAGLKEQQQAVLEGIRESQQETLAGLKEQQQSVLDSMRDVQQGSLEAMRESQQQALQALRDSQQEQVSTISEGATQAAEQVVDAASKAELGAKQKLGAMPKDFAEIGAKAVGKVGLAGALMVGAPLAGAGGLAILSATVAGLKDLPERLSEAGAAGVSGPKGYYKGVTDKKDVAESAGKLLKNATVKGLTDNLDTLKTGGQLVGNKFASGLAVGGRDVGTAVRGIQDAQKHMDLSAYTYAWGQHTAANYAQGLLNGKTSVKNAAASVASQIKAQLGHSVPKEGPLREGGKGEVLWGQHMVQNIERGILLEQDGMSAAMERLAQVAADSFDPDVSTDLAAQFERGAATREASDASFAARQQQPARQQATYIINANFYDPVVREEADFDRFAERIQLQMERYERSKL